MNFFETQNELFDAMIVTTARHRYLPEILDQDLDDTRNEQQFQSDATGFYVWR